MVTVNHILPFNSEDSGGGNGVIYQMILLDLLLFISLEMLKVIYDNGGQTNVGGMILISYYVSVVDNFKIKLHNTESNAISH